MSRRARIVSLLALSALGLGVLMVLHDLMPSAERRPAQLVTRPTALPPTPSATPPPWSGSVLAAVVREDGAVAVRADGPNDTDSQSHGASRAIALYPVASSGPPRRLIGGFDEIGRLNWSHDGSRLAFAGLRDGNWDVYLVSRDGAGLRRLTTHPAHDGDPAWSPDGRFVAFVSSRDGNLDLYRLSFSGPPTEAPQRLTTGNQPAIEPTWSPDGAWIAFVGWSDGAYRLEAVGADGSGRRLVEEHEGQDVRSPSWSASGDSILVVSTRHGTGPLSSVPWHAQLADDGASSYSTQDEVSGANRAARPISSIWHSASSVTGFSRFPEGPAVVTAARERNAVQLQLWDDATRTRTSLAALPADAGAVAWAQGPMPAGLAALSLADHTASTAPKLAVDSTNRPGLVRLPDVDVPGDRIHADLADGFAAMRAEVRDAVGTDHLGTLADLWRPLGYSGSSFFSWHKTGRAFDMQMELRGPGGRRNMVLVREDIRGRTYWRMFLRAAAQDGSVGAPLRESGWTFTAGGGDPVYADEGGRRGDRVPAGYWVDFTAIAARYGWHRIPSVTHGNLDWRSSWTGIDYWHYERRDGLRWFDAARQVYSDEELEAELHAARLRERGISYWRLARLGFPTGWFSEG